MNRDSFRLTLILFRHEMRMLIRDRRTVIISIFLPLVVMPLILLINKNISEKRHQKLESATYFFAITGDRVEYVRSLVYDGLAGDGPDTDNGLNTLKFEEVRGRDPKQDLDRGDLDFFLEGLKDEKDNSTDGRALDGPAPDRVPLVNIAFRGDRDSSQNGAYDIYRLLKEVRFQRQHSVLSEKGFPIGFKDLAPVTVTDAATKIERTGAGLGKFLTTLILLFIISGGAIIAIDTLAGERERGTLETLLTTAAERVEIVTAKQLAIMAMALTVTVIHIANLLIYIGLGLIPLPEDYSLYISWSTGLVLLVLMLPVAALASNVLLWVSCRSDSYKEAQMYFFPVIVLFLLLSAATILPGIELESAIVLLPVANISVAVKEVLMGRLDWPFLILSWMTTAAAAFITAHLTLKALSVERLITVIQEEESDQKFSRDVFIWFSLIWVVLFLAAANLEEMFSIKGRVLFNLVLVFGGASLIMIHLYGLKAREALALRLPSGWVWPLAVLGAPLGLLVSMGFFHLADLVFPVPREWLESMGRALVSQEIPLWQVLLFVALLPGLYEEIFFRGLLLHGLRQRFHPVLVCLVVGVIFGLFHFNLHRLIPTMVMGLILTALTMLCGSIFPAMLWHTLNNGLAVLMGHWQVPLSDLGPGYYLLSALGLVGIFYLIYLHRRPYPGLARFSRRKRQ